jgi:hypothetical protein
MLNCARQQIYDFYLHIHRLLLGAKTLGGPLVKHLKEAVVVGEEFEQAIIQMCGGSQVRPMIGAMGSLGNGYNMVGLHEEAVFHYRRAASLCSSGKVLNCEPNLEPDTWYNLGFSLHLNGHKDEAEQIKKKAMEICKKNNIPQQSRTFREIHAATYPVTYEDSLKE